MNISTEFTQEGLIYDRYLDLPLSLPYNYESIKIQANDTATYNLLNIKFKHLYDNFLYLYKNCKVASNVIPISSTGIAGVSSNSTRFTISRTLCASQYIPIYNNASLVGTDQTKAMLLIKNKDKNQYSAFTSNGQALRVFNFDSYGSYIYNAYTQTTIELGYGVPFSDINSFALADNFLYVLDSKLNRIVKYDAAGFTTGDNVKENKLYYVDSIGNFGNFVSKTEFNDPRGLTVFKNNLFVLDSGNSSIKKYDLNLNWLYTYRLYVDFLSAFPVDIASDSEGNIYVLTNSNKIFKYNNSISKKDVIDLSSLAKTGETFIKIVFSASDKNIYYVISNKNVYKRLVSVPQDNVGNYLFYLYKYDIPNDKITSFSSAVDTKNTSDCNIMFSISGNAGKFGIFYDNLNLFDILAVNDFDIYGADELKFNPEEYIQNWVFNKNLAKLIINHMRLRDQIIGKYIAARDRRGNVVFKGTRYLLPLEMDSLYFEQDLSYFIGSNELVNNNIVNRAFKKIYDIQENILKVLKADKTNFPDVDQYITLN